MCTIGATFEAFCINGPLVVDSRSLLMLKSRASVHVVLQFPTMHPFARAYFEATAEPAMHSLCSPLLSGSLAWLRGQVVLGSSCQALPAWQPDGFAMRPGPLPCQSKILILSRWIVVSLMLWVEEQESGAPSSRYFRGV
eukprot:gb/GECG01009417.1/.p1 GENE.gb/GECG01009417.1/~~gb/GECG01009417.1/.p1  ORF type:complete len:139 (+),score=3.16 gb/GECG01009417.1/:1-417(+)